MELSKKDLKEKVERFFTIYPHKDKLYATGDGNVFLVRSDAANHAIRSKINYFEFVKGESEEQEKQPGGEQAELQAQLKVRALEIDPEKDDYREMLKILKGLNKAPETNKKADTIKAFKAYQLILKAEQAPVAEAASQDTETQTQE